MPKLLSLNGGSIQEVSVGTLPTGGTSGQVLTKQSGTDFDVAWAFQSRKYTELIGDGSSTEIVVSHGLGTADVIPLLYDVATNETVECVMVLESGQVTFKFAVAPGVDAYRAVIIG